MSNEIVYLMKLCLMKVYEIIYVMLNLHNISRFL